MVSKQESDSYLFLFRIASLAGAFLYLTFGLLFNYIFNMADIMPFSQRLLFAGGFMMLFILSFVVPVVREHMRFPLYILIVFSVVHLLFSGMNAGFPPGSLVALLLIIPVLNFLFFPWSSFLLINALLLVKIVGIFWMYGPPLRQGLLFLGASLLGGGVSLFLALRLRSLKDRAVESEKLYGDLFHHSMDGLVVHDAILDKDGKPQDYIFIDINPAFEQSAGLSKEEILGKRLTEFLPDQQSSPILEKYAQVMVTGKPMSFEQNLDFPKGYFRITAYCMGRHSLAAVIEDITHVREAQEELQRSQERYRNIVNTQAEMICRFLPDTTLTFANPAYRRFFGLTDEDMHRTRFLDLVPEEEHASIFTHLETLVAGGHSIPYEHKVIMDGKTYRQRWQDYPIFDDSGTIKEFQSVGYDITDIREAQEELEETRQRLNLLIAETPAVIYSYRIQDEGPVLTYISDNVSHVLGYEKEDFLKDMEFWFSCVHPDDIPGLKEKLQGEEGYNEYRFRDCHGQYRWLSDQQRRITESDGQTLIVGAWWDITERVHAERQTEKQSALIASLLDSIPDLVFYKDTQGVYLGCNPAFTELVGMDREAIIGRTDYDLFEKDIAESFRDNDRQMLIRQQPRHNEEWITYPDGREVLVDTVKTPYRGPDHELIGILGISRNITERKAMEKALRQSEERFRALYENSPVSIIIHDRETGAIIDANNTAYEAYGLSSLEELQNNTFWLDPPYSQREALQYIHKATEEGPQLFEWMNKNTRGEVFWEQVRLVTVTIDNEERVLSTTIDITDRKKAEQKLWERDQLLTRLSEQVPGAIYQYRYYPDGTSCFPFASHGIWDVYEVQPEEVETDASPVYSRIHPQDYDGVVGSIRESFENLIIWRDEYRVILPQKGQRWVRGVARPERLPDGSVLWHGYLTDVTALKETETALEESEKKYKALVSNVPGVIFRCNNDEHWTMEFISKEIKSFTGYDAGEFVRNRVRSYASIIHAEDAQFVDDTVQEAIEKGEPYKIDYRIVHAQGTVRWMNENAQGVFSDQGELLYLYGVITDVTEQKKIEEALSESEEKFRQITENMGEVFWLRSADNKEMLYINPAYETVWGRSCESLYENPDSFMDSIYPQDRDSVYAEFARYAKTGDFHGEYRIVRPSGELRWVQARSFPVKDDENNVIRHTGLAVDITHRKAMEKALAEREEQLSSILTNTRDVLWSCAYPSYDVLFISPSSVDLYGYTEEDFAERPNLWAEVVHEEDRHIAENNVKMLEKEGTSQSEYRIIREDGAIVWVRDACYKVYDEAGIPIRVDGVISDISQQKEAEAKLLEYTKELELQGLELDSLYQRLNEEMDDARKVHEQLLLQEKIPSVEGLGMAAVCTSAAYIGGDFYQVIRKENKLILYLSDVTGHGLDGTMFSLFVKNTIESYIELIPIQDLTTESILSYLDEQVRKGGYPKEYAVAIYVMVIDIHSKEIAYSAAGFHTAPVLLSQDGSMESLLSKGMPISQYAPREIMDFSEQYTTLHPNSLLFLSTDGLYEQFQGEVMYEGRLLKVLQESLSLPEATIADLVQKDFDDFRAGDDQADDITFLIISTAEGKEYTFSSSFDSLEEARELVQNYYEDHDNCVGIVMAVHELMANAIEHGNAFAPDKQVRIIFSPDCVMIEDEGEGFDWFSPVKNVVDLDDASERGRGMILVQMMFGDLLYNKKGNRVSLFLDTPEAVHSSPL